MSGLTGSRRRWFLGVGSLACLVVALIAFHNDKREPRGEAVHLAPSAVRSTPPVLRGAPGRPQVARPPVPSPPPDPLATTPADHVVVHVLEAVPGADSKPLAGARVSLRDAEGAELQATAIAGGVASFDGVPPGEFRYRATAAGFVASEWQDVTRGLENYVVLERGTALEGIVVEARSGRPVAGALVRATGAEPLHGGSTFGSLYALPAIDAEARVWGEATSEANGRFRIDGLPPVTPQLLTARAEGAGGRTTAYAPALGKSAAPVEVRVGRGGRLVGTVRDDDGRPVGGALVAVAPESDARSAGAVDGSTLEDTRFGDGVTRIVRADGEGRYAIEDLELDAPHAIVSKGPEAPSEAVTGITLTAVSPERTLDLVLRRWGHVVIRVLTPEAKVPADAYASVEGWRGSGAGGPEPGAWTYAHVVPGSRIASAGASGWANGTARVEVRSGEISEVTVHLDAGVAVEGVVHDADGHATAELEVKAFWVGEGPQFGLVATTKTDAAGRFRFLGLSRAPHRFEAEQGDTVAVEALDVRDGVAPVRLVLAPAARLCVTVRDADGDPIGRASVDARGPVYRCDTAKGDGRCCFRLPPGRYRVGFTYSTDPADPFADVEVRRGETNDVFLRTR